MDWLQKETIALREEHRTTQLKIDAAGAEEVLSQHASSWLLMFALLALLLTAEEYSVWLLEKDKRTIYSYTRLLLSRWRCSTVRREACLIQVETVMCVCYVWMSLTVSVAMCVTWAKCVKTVTSIFTVTAAYRQTGGAAAGGGGSARWTGRLLSLLNWSVLCCKTNKEVNANAYVQIRRGDHSIRAKFDAGGDHRKRVVQINHHRLASDPACLNSNNSSTRVLLAQSIWSLD